MNPLFDVKSARLDVLSLQLKSNDFVQLEAALEQRLKQLGDFASMPFVLDLEQLDDLSQLPVDQFIRLFRRQGLELVGLRHFDENTAQLAAKHGLSFSILNAPQVEQKVAQGVEQMAAALAPEAAAVVETVESVVINAPLKQEGELELLSDRLAKEANITSFYDKPSLAEPMSDNEAKPTLVIRQPIRTGQQVYAENADLIVLAMVSVGAEIIADGNIHVYAPMRGRALAGATGNKKARIFIQNMQAELVSVAGVYRTFERDLPTDLSNKAIQVYLEDDKLVVGALNAQ
ncbi:MULTISPECIES: septum site-determining protein MinC [Vitreoscilla]|uniref:Probable septum site-determining protein MinC n=1 Tax=Vitreoscilla stercoraria TaxID=61 RepID=A0ABY4EG26_VITST|nr:MULTISPECIES: septum site-determining protein MinC [Vitreoscilla]AUZ06300.1 septum site-determining protein MinC [Vitreoscilla sp. C1]UOO92352.1 septum site-determining protein MinC [Vitreoscilla stercoraria]